MKVKLRLFFQWGIRFRKEYSVTENGNRQVAYAEKKEIMDAIVQKYHPEWLTDEDIPPNAMPAGGQSQAMHGMNEPSKGNPLGKAEGKRGGGSSLRTSPRSIHAGQRAAPPIEEQRKEPEQEVKPDGQI